MSAGAAMVAASAIQGGANIYSAYQQERTDRYISGKFSSVQESGIELQRDLGDLAYEQSQIRANAIKQSGLVDLEAANTEAILQEIETMTSAEDLYEEADRLREEGQFFEAEQRMSYIKSGVDLSGSPLLVLERTKNESEKEVKAVQKQARAILALGEAKASQVRGIGRSKMLGAAIEAEGILSAASMRRAVDIFNAESTVLGTPSSSGATGAAVASALGGLLNTYASAKINGGFGNAGSTTGGAGSTTGGAG